jgi:hypothetical protein
MYSYFIVSLRVYTSLHEQVNHDRFLVDGILRNTQPAGASAL